MRENQYYYNYEEERIQERIRMQRKRKRREEIRRRKRRRVFINRCIFGTCCLAILFGFVFLVKTVVGKITGSDKENIAKTENTIDIDEDNTIQTIGSNDTELYDLSGGSSIKIEEFDNLLSEQTKKYEAHVTNDTITTGSDVISEKSIIIDLSSGDILMQKGYKDRISPASMTKVLTVLVACENLTEDQLKDTFTITEEITNYAYSHDCSCVGFSIDETVTVEDLLYGTILPSGADAALGLANYIAGSHEEFVEKMNSKLEELELSDTTHMTNCIGLYDDNHYSSVYDMAMIMEAAIENPMAKKYLSAHKYTTTPTAEHPNGIEISNWFLRRIEDKDSGGTVICAKTGYVLQSKNCAVSYGMDNHGNEFVVCTATSTSSWRCIYDHVAIYKQFEGAVNNGSQSVSEETDEELTQDNNDQEVNGG